MLPSGRKHADCNIAAQGAEGSPTGCIKFRPPVHDHDGGVEAQAKFNKKTLLSVTCDGIVNHWDCSKGVLQHCMPVPNQSFLAADFACDGLRFVVAGSDSNVYLYDEASRELISTMNSNGVKIPGHVSRIFCTKFLPDDRNLLLTGGWDRTVKLYDTRVGRPVAQMGGPQICGDCIDINGDEVLCASNR